MQAAYNSARAIILTSILVSAVACGENPTVGQVAVRVEVSPSADTVAVGEVSARLSATAFNVRDEPLHGALFTWRSDQPFIVHVDSLTGSVRGIAPGVAAITARTGAVLDTAEVFVLDLFSLSLPLDTLLLAPGDTFTIPVDLIVRGGATPPQVRFSGGAAAVATVDPATGLVTAVNAGVVGFEVRADSLVATGGIEVLVLTDTTFGLVYLRLSGAATRSGRLSSRAFNHPTDDAGTAFNLKAPGPGQELLAILLTDSLVGPRVDTVGTLDPAAFVPEVVCLPPISFSFYIDPARTTALSLAGGRVAVTTLTPLVGGSAISGRFDLTLQRTDIAGAAGQIRARGTFIVPLISLAACPEVDRQPL